MISENIHKDFEKIIKTVYNGVDLLILNSAKSGAVLQLFLLLSKFEVRSWCSYDAHSKGSPLQDNHLSLETAVSAER